MDELEEIKKLAAAQKSKELTDGFGKPIAVGDKVIVSLPGSPISYLGVGTIENIRDTAFDGIKVDVEVTKATGRSGGFVTSVTQFSIMKI